jgi:LD-carboxypeptidase N-terminal domain
VKQRNLSIPAVRRGAKVAVLSPGSYPQPEKLAQGVEALSRLGFLPWVGRHALSKAHHYFAGTAQARLEDLLHSSIPPSARSFVAVEVTVATICSLASTWAWSASIQSRSSPTPT